jgi:hypothetical protein
MKTRKILFATGIALTAVLVVYLIRSKKAEKRRLRRVVAEEGYETAEDILFPRKKFLRMG